MLKDSPLMVDFVDGRTPSWSTFGKIYDILWHIARHEPQYLGKQIFVVSGNARFPHTVETLVNALGSALQRPSIDPFIKDPLLDTELLCGTSG